MQNTGLLATDLDAEDKTENKTNIVFALMELAASEEVHHWTDNARPVPIMNAIQEGNKKGSVWGGKGLKPTETRME